MIMCDAMFILLNLELDGELTSDEQKQLNEHRATCPTCQARTFELRQMSAAVRDLDATLPEGFHDRVLDQISQEQKSAKKVIPFATYVRRYGGVAACALLCVGLVQMGLHQKGTPAPEAMAPMEISQTSAAMDYTGDVMFREVQFENGLADSTASSVTAVREENILLIDTLPDEMPEGVQDDDTWLVSPNRSAHCYVSREIWLEVCDLVGVNPVDYENYPDGKYVIQLEENK